MDQRELLLKKLATLGLDEDNVGIDGPLPLISLEDFFEGNDDPESIGVNLMDDHPGLVFFREMLCGIRARPDVCSVLLEIYDISLALEDDDIWPLVEKVVFVTSAPISEVERWCCQLHADGPVDGFPDPVALNAPEVPAGFRACHTVWD